MNTEVARKRPRQDRAKATVDALVEATARLLIEEGWDGTSTNKIAARAGVSVGSLYQYFDGKEQLVIAVGERHHQQLMSVIAAAAADVADKELPEMVDTIIGAMLDAHDVDAELHRVLSEQIPSELIMSRIEEDGAAFLYGVFETQREKIRRDIDVDAAVFVLTHAVEGVTHASALGAAREKKKLKDKRVRQELARMVTAYLLPSP